MAGQPPVVVVVVEATALVVVVLTADTEVVVVTAGAVVVVDAAVAQRSARLHVPDPRPVRDGLIAATALVHGMTVVTRNVADFVPTGVATLNPWLVR